MLVIIQQPKRLVLSLPSDILFESGQAEIGVDGQRAIFALGNILSRIKNRIEVIGHSDPQPIVNAGGPFSSNWALSLSRALSVASSLNAAGYKRPVIVRGLASARYDELSESLPEEQRLDLSRRVDLVIMKDDGRHRLFQ